ncbi:MAG: metallophosphoesterase [Deltaproteobacteria bacterium]|nr:metallophosphoesterase [Deltaproteobacteria bacterium]
MLGVIVFYTIFTVLYALMNWLVFSRLISALSLPITLINAFKIWFIIMILSPALSNVTGERTGVWAAVTFWWFGLIFYLFLGALVLLFIKLIGGGGAVRPVAWGILSIGVLICLWGTIQAREIQVKEITVEMERLPAAPGKINIAVISDVHLHSVESESRLNRILTILNNLQFDLLISAGDLIETGFHLDPWEELAAKLAKIKPPLGKFAVNGNHEIYANHAAGWDISQQFHQAAGFELLKNRVRPVAGLGTLIGIDDPDGGAQSSEMVLLDRLPDQGPVLILKHRPQPDPRAVGRFQLMLSGHTHNGQLWPFGHVVKLFFPYLHGMFDLGQKSRLYVSAGTGTWGPPVRVGTTPEITLIKLVKAPDNQ